MILSFHAAQAGELDPFYPACDLHNSTSAPGTKMMSAQRLCAHCSGERSERTSSSAVKRVSTTLTQIEQFEAEKQFSERIGRVHLDFLKKNAQALHGVVKCLRAAKNFSEKPSNPDCAIRIAFFGEKKFREKHEEFRQLLSLTRASKAPPALLPERIDDHWNPELIPPATFPVETRLEEMQPDERVAVIKVLDKNLKLWADEFREALTREVAEIRSRGLTPPDELVRRMKEMQGLPGLALYKSDWPRWQAYVRTEMSKLRERAKIEALEILDHYPVLSYLREEDPTPSQLAFAIERMIGANEKQQAKIASNLRELTSNRGDPRAAMNALNDYSILVNHYLSNNPDDCQAASRIADRMVEQGNRKQVAITVLLLAAGTLVAPEVAMPFMTAAGAGFLVSADQNRRESLERASVGPIKEMTTGSMMDAYSAAVVLNQSALAIPSWSLLMGAEMALYNGARKAAPAVIQSLRRSAPRIFSRGALPKD